MVHIISYSGGKDSTATVFQFKEHWNELVKPGDRVIVIFVEIMFSYALGVSAHNPDTIQHINRMKALFESWGMEFLILRSEKDYLDLFNHRIKRATKHSEHNGMRYGFGAGSSRCAVRRDLKMKPIEKFWRGIISSGEAYISYVGIAADEKSRLESLHADPHNVSLLERYNITEKDARDFCEKNGVLSPQYYLVRDDGTPQKREGCFFCPEAKSCEMKRIKHAPEPQVRDAWSLFVSMEGAPDIAFNKWSTHSDKTLHELDAEL